MPTTALRPRRATMFTTPSDRELVATHILPAPRLRVFEAHVVPELIRGWMTGPEGWTMPVCEVDPRPGGGWRYRWSGPEGGEMEMWGEFREVVAPTRLVNTENWGGDRPEALTTTILTEDAGRTTITCRVAYPSRGARERARATGMEAGWAAAYERLDALLLG